MRSGGDRRTGRPRPAAPSTAIGVAVLLAIGAVAAAAYAKPEIKPATPAPPADDAKAKQERSRLIDHFKRVYQIVAGLAITEAVKHLSSSFTLPPNTAVWMFATFLITVVPIFHGGDRSLDLKYLEKAPRTFRTRCSYLWDVYMLIITATLFVGIAEKVPEQVVTTATQAVPFYRAMAAMLIFDVGVLIFDRIKTPKPDRGQLAPYWTWIIINTILATMCGAVGFLAVPIDGPVSHFHLMRLDLDLRVIAPAIEAGAFARTVGDYIAGSFRNFLFP